MQWTMTTVSWRYHLYSFRDIAALAERCGFDAIELWEPHFVRNQADIFEYVEQGSLPVPMRVCSAYHDLTDFSAGNEHWAEQVFAKLLTCKRLGIGTLRLFTGRLASAQATDADWQRFLERVDRIEAYCRQFDIDTVFENHPGTLLDSVAGAERLLQAVEKCSWQRIGINFDVFHVWEYGVDVLQYLQLWYRHVKHVHLKNAHCRTDQFGFANVYHPMGRYDHVSPLLEGVVDVRAVVEYLVQRGYRGTATLEHFAAPSVELFMRELKLLRHIVAQGEQVSA